MAAQLVASRAVLSSTGLVSSLVENRNGSVIAHGSMISSFKYMYNSRFLPCSMEILLSQAQVEYMPKNKNEYS
jgi:hypothetical protein